MSRSDWFEGEVVAAEMFAWGDDEEDLDDDLDEDEWDEDDDWDEEDLEDDDDWDEEDDLWD
ncbi:MAG: hypothetical protein U5R14_02340 [Gemmatimonadota bacterium]|nr:hypothetical protein [Gemmatimonadota bacterium]